MILRLVLIHQRFSPPLIIVQEIEIERHFSFAKIPIVLFEIIFSRQFPTTIIGIRLWTDLHFVFIGIQLMVFAKVKIPNLPVNVPVLWKIQSSKVIIENFSKVPGKLTFFFPKSWILIFGTSTTFWMAISWTLPFPSQLQLQPPKLRPCVPHDMTSSSDFPPPSNGRILTLTKNITMLTTFGHILKCSISASIRIVCVKFKM